MRTPASKVQELEKTVDAIVEDQVLAPSGRVRLRMKATLVCMGLAAIAFSFWFPRARNITGHDRTIYTLELLSISVGVGALIYAYVITQKQDRQLLTLASISKTIGTEVSKRERIERFFCVAPWRQSVYRCFVPAEFSERPLPSILAGDYHALQVLSGALGSNVVLESVPREFPSTPDSLATDTSKRNVIFLCAPGVNAALAHFVSSNNLQLPCWFADDADGRHLRIAKPHATLHSEADKHYRAARVRQNQKLPYEPQALVSDLGIMARITVGGTKAIILAGIHQYGTWIVAEFLDKIIRGDGSIREHEGVFFGRDDFLAVVYGEFSHETLQVREAMIEHNKVWTRTGGGEWDLASSEVGASS